MHGCEHEREYDNVHHRQAGALFGVRLVYFRDYCNVQIIVRAGLGDPFVCVSHWTPSERCRLVNVLHHTHVQPLHFNHG